MIPTRTQYQEKVRNIERELKTMQKRESELAGKIKKKLQEGAELVGEKLFKECFDFFQRKSQYVSVILSVNPIER
jgi:hypothetical protein